MRGSSESSLSSISSAEVEEALRAIVESGEFQNANRLTALLTYACRETHAGRADSLRAKTIAADVYGRSSDATGDSESVVRVDAGRLRRRLKEYYAGTGAGAAVRLSIPSGGYRVEFERIDDAPPEPVLTSAPPRVSTPIVAALVVSGVVISILVPRVFDSDVEAPASDLEIERRSALLEKSPAALQAVTIAEQARGLLFPAPDTDRIQATQAMFDRAIELDPSYFGGYAGSAQALATLVVFTPDQATRDGLMSLAGERAQAAIDLAPTDAWSQSALAWVEFVRGNYDRALEVSQRAVALAPDDFLARDYRALIALFSGEFEMALAAADPEFHAARPDDRGLYLNVSASAQYHLGEYRKTIDLYQTSARKGFPISAISQTYLVAANQALGESQEAERLLTDLRSAWPHSNALATLKSVFRYPEHYEQIEEMVRAASEGLD